MNTNTEYINLSKEKVFKTVFEEFYPFLLIHTKRYGFTEEVANDIVQESFIALWENRTDFDILPKVQSFLYSCVKNKSLNIINRNKVKEKYVNQIDPNDLKDNFISFLIEDESYRLIYEAIATLPPRMQLVIKYTLQGKDTSEIADELNIAPETVYSHRQLAYQRMRVILRNHYILTPLLYKMLNL